MSKPQFTQMMKMVIVVISLDAGAAKAQNFLDFLTPPKTEALVPMETILEAARAAVPGQVIEIELERKRRTWVYEVEILPQSGGRKMELVFDAQTGALLSRRKD
ncbi:MAG: hypothetical protein FJX40_08910 [Alphaproteobacteria bacterium]|nr:hypothetical protein [Alphaproteobacteria bacterium]